MLLNVQARKTSKKVVLQAENPWFQRTIYDSVFILNFLHQQCIYTKNFGDPNFWLRGAVVRALVLNTRGPGFKSRWPLIFFSFFSLLCFLICMLFQLILAKFFS